MSKPLLLAFRLGPARTAKRVAFTCGLVVTTSKTEGFEGFEGGFAAFEEASQHCVLKVCLSIFKFILFPVFNPLKRFRLDFFFFCARESILVYFWCLRCFILFSSLFPPKSDFVWTSSFFVWRKRFCQC